MTSKTKYALLQGQKGHTYLNTANTAIYFRNNNSTKMEMKTNGDLNVSEKVTVGKGLKVTGDLNATGNGYFGPAYIGKYGGTNSDYAHFSHKNMKSTSQYALLQYKEGHTYLNTANKGMYFRNNNSTKMEMKTNGDLYVTGNGYIGPAYIGKYKKTDSNYAHFSHKNNTGGSTYAFYNTLMELLM